MAECYLAYDWYATAEPRLDAVVVGFGSAGTRLTNLPQSAGCVTLDLHGRNAFLPVAACHTTTGPREPIGGRVQHPVSLSSTPQLGLDQDIVPVAEYLERISITQRFALVRRQNGQVAYVPEILLRQVRDNPRYYTLKQPVRVYDLPIPGGQSGGAAAIFPEEHF
jgi:hypothetical protein